MFKYEYNEHLFYINIQNIASLRISKNYEIDFGEYPSIYDFYDPHKYILYIKYTGGGLDKFRFDTKEKAIELADNMAEYIINSHNKCCTQQIGE